MDHNDENITAAGTTAFLALPADEVVAELKNSPLPTEARALEAALSAGELGLWHYDFSPFLCLYGFHQYVGSLDHFPIWDGGVDPKSGLPTHAAGFLQDEPATFQRVAAKTNRFSFYPQDQIVNNWVLAVDDFARRGGGDLLSALQVAGRDTKALADVAAKLHSTWPGGADANFAARYMAALDLFAESAPAPAPTPVPPSPPPSASPVPILLRPGMFVTFPVSGIDQDGLPYLPDDAFVSDDAGICGVSITDGIATISAIGVGRTLVHGADLVLSVVVEPRRLIHLVADLSRLSRPAAMVAALGMIMMMPATLAPDPGMAFFRPVELAALPARVAPLTQIPELPDPAKPIALPPLSFCLVGAGRTVHALPLYACGAKLWTR